MTTRRTTDEWAERNRAGRIYYVAESPNGETLACQSWRTLARVLLANLDRGDARDAWSTIRTEWEF